MEKYIVKVDILKSDKDGNTESEIFEFNYNEANLIDSRNMAIKKTMDLITLYFHELPEENRFISIGEVIQTEEKKFNTIQIYIIFSPSEGVEHLIYESVDTGEMIEALEQEALYYKKSLDSSPMIYFHDGYCYGADVLESDINFFLEVIEIDYELTKKH